MKVLVIGKGGREHAIAHAVSKSKKVTAVYAAPGNPGMKQIATNVNISDSDVEGLVAFAKENQIDLTIVGPEHTLSLGVVDAFQKEGLKIFGPTKAAAQVESSKDFAKQIMMRHGIPTAAYATFDDKDAAVCYVKEKGVKAFHLTVNPLVEAYLTKGMFNSIIKKWRKKYGVAISISASENMAILDFEWAKKDGEKLS